MIKAIRNGRAVGLLCVGIVLSGCATGGGWNLPERKTCAAIGGLLGGTAGGIINGSGNETDEILAGGGIGAAAGAALGYLLCQRESEKASPRAEASATPSEGVVPLTVDFRGVGRDSDGQVVGYAWDFGDGGSATGARATHTYDSPGRYVARLTVTDNDGLTDSDGARVRVNEPEAAAPVVTRRIVLRGVKFDFNSSAIRGDAEVILGSAVEVLKESPEVRVEIAGHTDSTGPEAYNQTLSEQRANGVLQYMTSHGIRASRLSIVGHGEMRPVADNSTRDGRTQNRRVELNVSQ